MPDVRAFAAIHNRWLDSLFDEEIPNEIYTTCAACPMCDPASVKPANRVRPFSSATKCCTYWPVLANYLVGSALSDSDEKAQEGAQRLMRLVATDVAVPRGLGVPAEYNRLYSQVAPREFGDRDDLVCPFYESGGSGSCTIWRHRNGVCASWHCKPRRGADGQSFWQSTKALVTYVERVVSLWCAIELGIRLDAARTLPRDAETPRQSEEHESPRPLWGSWDRRHDDFYRACFERASSLSWQDVRRIGGIELDVYAAAARSALKKNTATPIVRRAIPGAVTVIGRTDTEVFVQSYSESDPQRVDVKVFHALRHCHGQPIEQFRATARREDGVEIDDALVRRLADVRILLRIA